MKTRGQRVSYPGMERALTVRPAPGRPDLVEVNVNFQVAPPEKAVFADHVQVERVRDGVRVLFAKIHPTKPALATSVIEVSLPFKAFINQLYKSFATPRVVTQL